MKIYKLIPVVILLGMMAACGEPKEEVIPEPTEEVMTATINDRAWRASVADLFIFDTDFVLNAQELDENNVPIRTITIQSPFSRPGTYGIGAVNGNEVGYFESTEQGDISRGALVISRVTERWVEGTFNFEGSIGRGLDNRRVSVTNGRFALRRN